MSTSPLVTRGYLFSAGLVVTGGFGSAPPPGVVRHRRLPVGLVPVVTRPRGRVRRGRPGGPADPTTTARLPRRRVWVPGRPRPVPRGRVRRGPVSGQVTKAESFALPLRRGPATRRGPVPPFLRRALPHSRRLGLPRPDQPPPAEVVVHPPWGVRSPGPPPPHPSWTVGHARRRHRLLTPDFDWQGPVSSPDPAEPPHAVPPASPADWHTRPGR